MKFSVILILFLAQDVFSTSYNYFALSSEVAALLENKEFSHVYREIDRQKDLKLKSIQDLIHANRHSNLFTSTTGFSGEAIPTPASERFPTGTLSSGEGFGFGFNLSADEMHPQSSNRRQKRFLPLLGWGLYELINKYEKLQSQADALKAKTKGRVPIRTTPAFRTTPAPTTTTTTEAPFETLFETSEVVVETPTLQAFRNQKIFLE